MIEQPLFIDHYGRTWWLAEGLTIALFAWALGTILAYGPPLWVSVTLIASFVCWVLFVVLSPRHPRAAASSLAACSLSPAAALMAGETSMVVVSVLVLGVYASHPAPRTRTIVMVTLANIAAIAMASVVTDLGIMKALTTTLIAVIVLLIGINRRKHQFRARQTELLLEQTRLARSEHARAAALDERTRIAREIHDVLAHSLGALSIQLKVVEAELAAGKDPASALERIQRCSKLASEGLAEARNAVSALRRDVPTLPEAIAELADDHQRDHGATATLRSTGTERPIPSAATVSLLGAVREALTNAARHAPGAPITITIDYTDTAVRVVVRNESTDPRPRDEGTGFGLTGMAERVALAGGSLTAGPDGDGWSVIATMPLQHVDHPAREVAAT